LENEQRKVKWELIRRDDLPLQISPGKWIIARHVIYRYADQPLREVIIPEKEWSLEREDSDVLAQIKLIVATPKEIREGTI